MREQLVPAILTSKKLHLQAKPAHLRTRRHLLKLIRNEKDWQFRNSFGDVLLSYENYHCLVCDRPLAIEWIVCQHMGRGTSKNFHIIRLIQGSWDSQDIREALFALISRNPLAHSPRLIVPWCSFCWIWGNASSFWAVFYFLKRKLMTTWITGCCVDSRCGVLHWDLWGSYQDECLRSNVELDHPHAKSRQLKNLFAETYSLDANKSVGKILRSTI